MTRSDITTAANEVARRALNPSGSASSKHIDACHDSFLERVEDQRMGILPLDPKLQHVDTFTKPLETKKAFRGPAMFFHTIGERGHWGGRDSL